ncbi:MAG: hypothetical protein HC904_12195 [Blastochloris sp.]|nr:hypothetical protein [Blastochloris sp.]
MWRWTLGLLVVLGVWALNTQNHQFHWGYHNDESSKVRQIQSGERNLRHPPLMLEVVDLGMMVKGGRENPQRVVEMGRILSALYMALALALLVDWAWVRVHPLAALGLAMVLPFHAGLFEVGHYFKEDALFLLGIAAALRALDFWLSAPGVWSAVLLGLSLALLGGGKYIGWIMVGCVAVEIGRQAAQSKRSLRWVGLSFLLATLAIYLPVLVHLERWGVFFKEEVTFLLGGDYGAGLATPHGVYWKLLCDDFSLIMLVIGLGTFALGAWSRRLPGAWLMPLVCILSLSALAFTSKYSERYLLPVQMLAMVIMVSGPVLLCHEGLRRVGLRSVISQVLLLGATCFFSAILMKDNLGDFRERWQGFQTDSRLKLFTFIRQHLTPGEVQLAQDTMVQFEDPAYLDGMKHSYFVADLGSLEELKAQGFTHLLLSYDVYHRYVDQSQLLLGQAEEGYWKRSEFYREALARGRVLWSAWARNPKALHPGLSLVELP